MKESIIKENAAGKERMADLKERLAAMKKRDQERKIRHQQRREQDIAERRRQREATEGKSWETDSLRDAFGVEMEKAAEVLSKVRKLGTDLDAVEKDVSELASKI